MIKKSQIKSSTNSTELTRNIIKYFQESGFKIQESNENNLIFTKGSYITNLGTFNPLNWKSIITVEIKSEIVEATFDIKTFGQIVTGKEIELWDNFIQNFENEIGNSEIDETKSLEIRKQIDKEGGKLMIWSLIGGGLGIITYFLFKQNPVNFILAGAFGAIGSLMFSLIYSFISKLKK